MASATSKKTLPPCVVCAYPASKRCGGCSQVSYCSQAHQKQCWPKHKKLCKIYQESNPPPLDTYCGLCGATENLTETDCCGRTICDDVDSYQMFTYTRTSCWRNHDRYTTCSFHHKEGHGDGKWQDCEKCKGSFKDNEVLVNQGTNSFNFKEDVWESPPKFEPIFCLGCKKQLRLGSDAHSPTLEGYQCMSCTMSLFT